MRRCRVITYTDVHIHLLYGMDDGPKAPKDMEALLKDAARNHVECVVVTPHIVPGIEPFDCKKYRHVLTEAHSLGKRMTPPVEVCGGAEILYSPMTCDMLRDGRIPTLAGTDIVLVEFSPSVSYRRMQQAINDIVGCGFLPMLAHVERYRCFVECPILAKRLKKDQTVLYQVNATWFLRRQNLPQRWFLHTLVKNRLIDAVGSDAHSCNTRPIRLKEAYPTIKKICGEDYARELTDGSVLFRNDRYGSIR